MNWKVGDKRSIVRTITREDIALFAQVSGDDQRLHLDDDFARTTRFGGVVAHGMLTAGIFSALLGKHIPGEGTILVSVGSIHFHAPIRPGDEVTYTAEISEIGDRGRYTLTLKATNATGVCTCDATAQVVYKPVTTPAAA